jgi:hypothetical protein
VKNNLISTTFRTHCLACKKPVVVTAGEDGSPASVPHGWATVWNRSKLKYRRPPWAPLCPDCPENPAREWIYVRRVCARDAAHEGECSSEIH